MRTMKGVCGGGKGNKDLAMKREYTKPCSPKPVIQRGPLKASHRGEKGLHFSRRARQEGRGRSQGARRPLLPQPLPRGPHQIIRDLELTQKQLGPPHARRRRRRRRGLPTQQDSLQLPGISHPISNPFCRHGDRPSPATPPLPEDVAPPLRTRKREAPAGCADSREEAVRVPGLARLRAPPRGGRHSREPPLPAAPADTERCGRRPRPGPRRLPGPRWWWREEEPPWGGGKGTWGRPRQVRGGRGPGKRRCGCVMCVGVPGECDHHLNCRDHGNGCHF